MEIKIKCSSKDHLETNAIIYCIECKIYMCNKCEKIHSNLCPSHHPFNLDKNINEIFTGFCKEIDHNGELKYYCKSHNQLCCAFCVVKIKGEGNGQHTDCEICFIKDIKDEKKEKLKENIKILENLSMTLEESINKLKIIIEKVNENKELLKSNIQKIFTKIRNTLNEREDELLLEVDKRFNDIYCNEDILRENEKLPNKIKLSLDKGKLIDKEWNNNELNIMINDCITIENNIKNINKINENIQKCGLESINNIKFIPEEEDECHSFLETIKKFGKICDLQFRFKQCPLNANENVKYTVENENIFTKNGKNGCWSCGMCQNSLQKSKEYKWKIRILKTKQKVIMVGVAPIDFDINISTFNTCGWYFYCYYSSLYSGPPYNYFNKGTNLSKVNNEIIIIMNMTKRTLKFIINNEDKGESYNDIPLDKPITPAFILHDLNDSVEIIEC